VLCWGAVIFSVSKKNGEGQEFQKAQDIILSHLNRIFPYHDLLLTDLASKFPISSNSIKKITYVEIKIGL